MQAGPRVLFVGMGHSLAAYLHWSIKKVRPFPYDLVWTVNGTGRRGSIAHDLCFVMDDLRSYVRRKFPEWDAELQQRQIPFITSTAYDEYPAAQPFPMEAVGQKIGHGIIERHGIANGSGYAVLYAIYIGASELTLAGVDFDSPDGQVNEQGKDNTAFYLGIAESHGVKVKAILSSTMMRRDRTDYAEPYGYDREYVPPVQVNQANPFG